MSVGHNIAMALRSAYWAMHRSADAVLAPFGVTANQFVLLSLLADQDGITQQQLVERASSDANTVRAMLLLLEDDGLISRRAHPTDGRARAVVLTARGRRTYQRLWADSQSFRRRLEEALSAEQAVTMIQSLNKIAVAMHPPARGRRRREPAAAGV